MDRDNASPKIPLTAEELRVEKRSVVTGRVRVKTVVDSFEQIVKESLKTERLETTRVEIGKEIDSIPSVRTEGNTTVIPVVEEVLIVEKRLFLTEEIHIRRVISNDPVEASVTLRKQRAVVERDDIGES
jgi:stress response protein YsnF